MPSLHSAAEFLLHVLKYWTRSISHPKQFLAPDFHPLDGQLIDGIEFYFAMLVVSLLLYAPFVLGQRGEFAEKASLAAGVILGLLSTTVIAMTWHLAFSLLGGGASFGGTCLAVIHANGPYLPLMAFASLIVFAALPADLQRHAVNPATAKFAMERGIIDPRTNKGLSALGGLATLALLAWSAVVTFRCLSFVHGLLGLWRVAGAVALSALIAAPLSVVFKAVASVLSPGGAPDVASAGMIRVSVLYPRTDGSTFDMAYYCNTHVPMLRRKLGESMKGVTVEQGIEGDEPGSPAPYVALGHLLFESVDTFRRSFEAHAQAILGDARNYTNTQPKIQISEIKL